MAETPPEIPDHVLLRSIGKGAYGEVWLARNLTGAYRAVKVVYRSRFENEKPFNREFEGIEQYEPVSRLHPSQLDILHVGNSSSKDYFYYIMELADDRTIGPVHAKNIQPEDYVPRTLRSELAGGKVLPLEQCVDLGLSLTTALDNLHGHHLVHRDIKPSNIVYVNGEAKLADIGLVASVQADMSMVGTPGFIAPEGPGTLPADLYGLGKTLYEAATGKDRQEFPESPTLNDKFSSEEDYMELHAVLLKSCETAPRDRYPSAQSMHADLMLLKKGKSVKRLHYIERRFKLFARLGIAAALVMILAVAAFFYQRHASKRARELADQLQKNLYAAEMKLAYEAIEDIDLVNARQILDGHRPSKGETDLRGWEWYWLWHQSKGDQIQTIDALNSDQQAQRHLSYARDGAYLLDGEAIWEMASGETVTLIPETEKPLAFSPFADLMTARTAHAVHVYETDTWSIKYSENVSRPVATAFSHDGRWMAVGSEDPGLTLWNLATGATKTVRNAPKFEELFNATGLAFSRDDTIIVTVTGLGYDNATKVAFWTVPDLTPLPNLRIPSDNVVVARFSPDGHSLVTGDWSGNVRVWEFERGEGSEAMRLRKRAGDDPPVKGGGRVFDLAFTPDGRNHLATIAGDLLVNIWDLDSNQLVERFIGHFPFGDTRSVAFNPVDNTLAVHGVSNINLFKRETDKGEDVLRLGAKAFPLGISSDSQTLVTASETGVHFWDIGSDPLIEIKLLGSEADAREIHPSDIFTIRFAISPDLKTLAIGKKNGELVVWNVDSWKRIELDAPHAGEGIGALGFSPDSRTLATLGLDGLLKIWDVPIDDTSWVPQREIMVPLKMETPPLPFEARFRVTYSEDGSSLAVSDGHTIGILDLPGYDWKMVMQVEEFIVGLALASDRKYFATTHEGQIHLWDVETKALIATDSDIRRIGTSACLPVDGRTLIGTNSSGSLNFYNLAAGQLALSIPAHDETIIRDSRLSPNGQILVTTDIAGVIKVWRAPRPE